MADSMEIAGKGRIDFADMLDGLSAEQLATETLCPGWTPVEVGAHLVSFIEMSLPTMMLSMAKAGFNVDKAWKANATKYAAQGPAEISRKLRAHATQPAPMKSFPAGLTANDVAVHTQDVRRGLGLDGELDPAVLRMALDFCTIDPKGKIHVPPKDIAGLRLEATDMDWSWGEGDLVSGPAEAILMSINRRDARSELDGPGVSKLPR